MLNGRPALALPTNHAPRRCPAVATPRNSGRPSTRPDANKLNNSTNCSPNGSGRSTTGPSGRHTCASRPGFTNYSFLNWLAIMAQRPDATAVAGYQAGQAKGYQIRKRETAIRVLGSVTT